MDETVLPKVLINLTVISVALNEDKFKKSSVLAGLGNT
jgi:hypothetical protein